ncbi:cell division protein FtsQ/DivIB [Cellulophaga sp. Asnod2-G02]|uniref:cell division protein FtsQ/DivIB n=1 Tax=Cellulophaga sp. Asnod2-G02 TaxID=3160572 RepID=UPI00386C6201
MKVNWNIVKVLVLLLTVMGLFAFSNSRHSKKPISELDVMFTDENNLYVTTGMVNKLLIQSFQGFDMVPKENLVLNNMEKAIEANEMVKNAQVYLTVNGKLTTKIAQRNPIGRVESSTIYYLDDEGKRMPLSRNHSARVPVITGNITEDSLAEVHFILNYVNGDDFLRKNVIGIQVLRNQKYQLKFRTESFVVNLGKAEELDQKFNKFRAFYKKGKKDNSLTNYSLVSLEYNNQVVCTKI